MKPVIAITMLSLAVGLMACQENREQLAKPLSESDLYKTIGEQIPYETGMEWINLYRKKSGSQGRTELFGAYSMSATTLSTMLKSVDDLTGVAFHYGLDGLGVKHIMAIPVNNSLNLWSGYTGRRIIDANTGTEISEETAKLWADRFKAQNGDEIWFHFFGKEVFDEILALPYLSTLDIEPAISSLDLTPQLLLVLWTGDLLSFGRTSGEEPVVYDASNACPPCAVQ